MIAQVHVTLISSLCSVLYFNSLRVHRVQCKLISISPLSVCRSLCVQVTFVSNHGGDGGALYVTSTTSITFLNCIFSNNIGKRKMGCVRYKIVLPSYVLVTILFQC